MDKLVDGALVAGFQRTQGLFGRVGDLDQLVFIAAMGGSGNDIEFGRLGRVVALKIDFLGALGDIEAILISQLVHGTVHGYAARAAHVEHAALPALQEIIGAEVMPDIDSLIDAHLFIHRHHAQRDHAVHMAVHGDDLVRRKQLFDQELLAGLLGGIALEVALVAAVTNIHLDLLLNDYLSDSQKPHPAVFLRSPACVRCPGSADPHTARSGRVWSTHPRLRPWQAPWAARLR